jgi:hypothetical protein
MLPKPLKVRIQSPKNLFKKAEQQKRKTENSSPLSAQVKEGWSITSISVYGMVLASTYAGTCEHLRAHFVKILLD